MVTAHVQIVMFRTAPRNGNTPIEYAARRIELGMALGWGARETAARGVRARGFEVRTVISYYVVLMVVTCQLGHTLT